MSAFGTVRQARTSPNVNYPTTADDGPLSAPITKRGELVNTFNYLPIIGSKWPAGYINWLDCTKSTSVLKITTSSESDFLEIRQRSWDQEYSVSVEHTRLSSLPLLRYRDREYSISAEHTRLSENPYPLLFARGTRSLPRVLHLQG